MTTHRDDIGTALPGDDVSTADDAFIDEPAGTESSASRHETAWAGGTADTGTTDDTDDRLWDEGAQATDEPADVWDGDTEVTGDPDGTDADRAEAVPATGAWDEAAEETDEPADAEAARAETLPNAGAFALTTAGTTGGTTDAADGTDGAEVLFAPEDSVEFERRWLHVQTEFVDHPRAAVESADDLVHEVMQTLSRRLEARKDSLEGQWCSGHDVDTEELRQAMQDYRAFFHRLLAV